MSKINYRSGEECIHATYDDMKDMTLEDAIYILSQSVQNFHSAKTEMERTNLPRPRLIKAYELLLEAAKVKYWRYANYSNGGIVIAETKTEALDKLEAMYGSRDDFEVWEIIHDDFYTVEHPDVLECY